MGTFGTWVYGFVLGYPLLALLVVLHCLTIPWVCMLCLHQSRLVAMNLTTNEMMNMSRYDHFKVLHQGMTVGFFNPFHKGSKLKNCLDFWWSRNRTDIVNTKPDADSMMGGCGDASCRQSHGQHHGHGH